MMPAAQSALQVTNTCSTCSPGQWTAPSTLQHASGLQAASRLATTEWGQFLNAPHQLAKDEKYTMSAAATY